MEGFDSFIVVYCMESEGSMMSEDNILFWVFLEKEFLGYLIVLFLEDVFIGYF